MSGARDLYLCIYRDSYASTVTLTRLRMRGHSGDRGSRVCDCAMFYVMRIETCV